MVTSSRNTVSTVTVHLITSLSPKRLVTQDNVLVNAAYQMSLDEKRLLLLGISKIDPRHTPTITQPFQFEINASEWHAYFGGSKKSMYDNMKSASERLMKRQVEVKEDSKRGIKRKLMQWVDQCEYLDGEGRVKITFGSNISTYLTGLKSHFTKTDLINVGALGTLNSIRIYEMLSQFRDTGIRIQQVEDLKEMLDITGLYQEFNDLKKRVIAPSVKEINEKTDLFVSWEPIKTGRKITGLKFIFRAKEQMRLAF